MHLKEAAELVHETGLYPAFFEAAKQPLSALSKALSVSPSQAACYGSLKEFQTLRSGSHPLIESGLVELASAMKNC